VQCAVYDLKPVSSPVMAGCEKEKPETCQVCNMAVMNIKVHMKLNHKKEKPKQKYAGFQGHSSSIQGLGGSKLKDIYARRAEITQSKYTEKIKKHKAPVNENISLKLSLLGEHFQNEVMNSAVPVGLGDEVALLGGLDNMSRILKNNISNLNVQECPECQALFQMTGNKRNVWRREFRDHIGICGLGGDSRSMIKFKFDPSSEYETYLDPFNLSESGLNSEKIKVEIVEPEVIVGVGVKEEMLNPEVVVGIKKEIIDVEVAINFKEEICEPVADNGVMEFLCGPENITEIMEQTCESEVVKIIKEEITESEEEAMFDTEVLNRMKEELLESEVKKLLVDVFQPDLGKDTIQGRAGDNFM